MTTVVFLLALLPVVCWSEGAVEQWGRWEKSWSANASGNPFDVEFTVELSCSDCNPAPPASWVRGFYDGNSHYTARFMPPTTGTWSWATKSNVTSLNGATGQFVVHPPTPGDANRGPVQVSKVRNTTFAYADGTPFLSVGTTVYGLFADEANRTARTLASLDASPFNKVRSFAFGAGSPASPPDLLPYQPEGGVPGAASDLTRFHLPYFRNLERTVASLGAIGVQADVILFNLYMKDFPAGLACLGGPNSSSYDLFFDARFVRYLVARLGSFRNVRGGCQPRIPG
jgi:hypothetical protein